MPKEQAMLADPESSRKSVAQWLFLCAGLVALMVLMGGYTRLSGSGLAITEWRPVSGTLPPWTETAWQEEFAKYQRTPEYLTVNAGMTLGEFKDIYQVEYLHRLFGRIAGAVFLLPFLYFLKKRRLERPMILRLAGLFLLGALQGAMGWYMVKSGLAGDPRVSQYRLTAHLLFAFAIYGYLLWLLLDLVFPAPAWAGAETRRLRRFGRIFTALVLLQVAAGGLVAGMDAGLIYNTFPHMNGQWVPGELLAMQPWHVNFTENPVTAQFVHRVLAFVVFFSGLFFWWLGLRRSGDDRLIFLLRALIAVLCLQLLLGITTLMYQVPLSLALLHQAGALALFTISLCINHHSRAIS